MPATTTTDRARLVDLALSHGWTVQNMGQYFTELVKDGREVALNWEIGDRFYELADQFGNTLTTDQAEAANLLRGERLRDAKNARYFEVTSSVDASVHELAAKIFRETSKDHAFVGTNVSYPERNMLAMMAYDAKSMAQVSGSRAATQVETVFGVELHVTWKRA